MQFHENYMRALQSADLPSPKAIHIQIVTPDQIAPPNCPGNAQMYRNNEREKRRKSP